MNIPPRVRFALVLACLCATPVAASSALHFGSAASGPYVKEFIVTAYYSPLPHQCCYVRGSFLADAELNGWGEQGAGGTPVHAGMAAAPSSYTFGTRIALPGLGTVTVEDRGSAIQTGNDGSDRLDIWAGSGELGLARALAFGARRIRAVVYPLGNAQPDESFDLASLPSPLAMIQPYLSADASLLSMQPTFGEQSLSVVMLQDALKNSGYFDHAITGYFGDTTQVSLAAFMGDFGIHESNDQLHEKTAATLMAMTDRSKTSSIDLSPTNKQGIATAQRTLRFLGYYRGRTDGVYGSALRLALLSFQKEQRLVKKDSDPGAGRLGPQTRNRIAMRWQRKLVAQSVERMLLFHRVEKTVADRDMNLTSFLSAGDHGQQVRRLQQFLVDRKFLPSDRVTGTFADQTREALVAYQLASHIIPGENAKGAGVVGPATLLHLQRDLVLRLYRLVRAEGWRVL
ncbi:peptidoglycan-binding protein [Candidatus Peregrinibacteria bacterium]|nr:peptidoglycan-binding protein [Candidatus Peregrinibacteria bacterium]